MVLYRAKKRLTFGALNWSLLQQFNGKVLVQKSELCSEERVAVAKLYSHYLVKEWGKTRKFHYLEGDDQTEIDIFRWPRPSCHICNENGQCSLQV